MKTNNKSLFNFMERCWVEIKLIELANKYMVKTWNIKRIDKCGEAILKMGIYELKYTDTPEIVVINEAIELTKIYTNLDDDKAKAFNNKLLDNIAKNIARE